MIVELPMAQRNMTSHLGDLGETEVLLELLEIGTSVNLITGSDYGWDLHVQVPLNAMQVKDFKDRDSWEMSGRSAHIQVKKKSKNGSPSVAPGTISGWVTGSSIGVPTFIFIVGSNSKRYLTPRDLDNLLSAWNQKNIEREEAGKKRTASVTLPWRSAKEYEPEIFSWLLHLWTKYPGIMYQSTVDDWPERTGGDLYGDAVQFIADVVLAWMKSHFSDVPIGPHASGTHPEEFSFDLLQATQAVDALGIAQAAFRIINKDGTSLSEKTSEVSHEIFNILQEAIVTLNYRWPKSPLMFAYAMSPDMGKSRQEAINLLRDVMQFHLVCSERLRIQ